MFCCGTTDPGTAARASRKSSTSAVRIEVSWRHAQRDSSTGLRAGGAEGGWGGCEAEPPAPVSVVDAVVVMRGPRGSVTGVSEASAGSAFVGCSHRHLETGDHGAEVGDPLV